MLKINPVKGVGVNSSLPSGAWAQLTLRTMFLRPKTCGCIGQMLKINPGWGTYYSSSCHHHLHQGAGSREKEVPQSSLSSGAGAMFSGVGVRLKVGDKY